MSKPNTASFLKLRHCKDCGWPVICACCNDNFIDFSKDPEAKLWDWYYYCSNKSCKNHAGEGVNQNHVEWLESDFKAQGGVDLHMLNGIDIEAELIKMAQANISPEDAERLRNFKINFDEG